MTTLIGGAIGLVGFYLIYLAIANIIVFLWRSEAIKVIVILLFLASAYIFMIFAGIAVFSFIVHLFISGFGLILGVFLLILIFAH